MALDINVMVKGLQEVRQLAEALDKAGLNDPKKAAAAGRALRIEAQRARTDAAKAALGGAQSRRLMAEEARQRRLSQWAKQDKRQQATDEAKAAKEKERAEEKAARAKRQAERETARAAEKAAREVEKQQKQAERALLATLRGIKQQKAEQEKQQKQLAREQEKQQKQAVSSQKQADREIARSIDKADKEAMRQRKQDLRAISDAEKEVQKFTATLQKERDKSARDAERGSPGNRLNAFLRTNRFGVGGGQLMPLAGRTLDLVAPGMGIASQNMALMAAMAAATAIPAAAQTAGETSRKFSDMNRAKRLSGGTTDSIGGLTGTGFDPASIPGIAQSFRESLQQDTFAMLEAMKAGIGYVPGREYGVTDEAKLLQKAVMYLANIKDSQERLFRARRMGLGEFMTEIDDAARNPDRMKRMSKAFGRTSNAIRERDESQRDLDAAIDADWARFHEATAGFITGINRARKWFLDLDENYNDFVRGGLEWMMGGDKSKDPATATEENTKALQEATKALDEFKPGFYGPQSVQGRVFPSNDAMRSWAMDAQQIERIQALGVPMP